MLFFSVMNYYPFPDEVPQLPSRKSPMRWLGAIASFLGGVAVGAIVTSYANIAGISKGVTQGIVEIGEKHPAMLLSLENKYRALREGAG